VSRGLRNVTSIEQLELQGKTVFIRVDFNVPMEKGKITDDTRIVASMPTIEYALKKGATVIVASHLGRPKKMPEDRKKFSLEPVADYISEKFGYDVVLVEDPDSAAPKALLGGLKKKQFIMLENLRFAKDEEGNGHEMASTIANYIDIYVNDAFGASHRAHCSVDELPKQMQKRAAGFLMQKEITMLDKVVDSPTSPYWVVMGGAKVSDKIGMIERLIDKVDGLIIGGAMAYTFLEAMDIPVGKSLVEKDKVEFARGLIERMKARKKPLLLPVDHRIAQDIEGKGEVKVTEDSEIISGWMGVDIGPKSERLFTENLKKAKTVFWNGPMGIFEVEKFSQGTFAIAKALTEVKGDTIVGGGDSASAIKASGYADKVTHISTGGGASLEYLQGDTLPGLESLRRTKREEPIA
jgi:phosphoglycerate kinase